MHACTHARLHSPHPRTTYILCAHSRLRRAEETTEKRREKHKHTHTHLKMQQQQAAQLTAQENLMPRPRRNEATNNFNNMKNQRKFIRNEGKNKHAQRVWEKNKSTYYCIVLLILGDSGQMFLAVSFTPTLLALSSSSSSSHSTN